MFLLLNVFLFYSLMIWKPCSSQYVDWTASRMKGKINQLVEEVVKDAEMKIESIQHLKRGSEKSTAYQYGFIVYQIGDRFKRMVFIYNQTLSKVNVDDEDKHVNRVAEMDNLAHEILALAEMIEMRQNQSGGKGNPRTILLRTNDDKIWQNLAESEDNSVPPTPPPIVKNETITGKRKNGVWHYAVPHAFDK